MLNTKTIATRIEKLENLSGEKMTFTFVLCGADPDYTGPPISYRFVEDDEQDATPK